MELPPDVGEITVYNAEELIVAQQALRVFDQGLVVLVIATPLLFVAAVSLSRSRRGTILQLAVGSVLLLVLVRRVVLRFEETIVAMPPQPEGRAAARAVTEQLRGGLFELTGVVIAVALLILVVAVLTGPYGWATALRRGIARLGRGVWDAGGRLTTTTDTPDVVGWVAERRQALQIGGALLLTAVLLLSNVSWGWFLTLVALLAAWELALWHLAGASPPALDGDRAPATR